MEICPARLKTEAKEEVWKFSRLQRRDQQCEGRIGIVKK